MTNRNETFKPGKKQEKSFDRLKTEKDFELVYKRGNNITSEDKKIKAKYFFSKNNENNKIKFGVSVTSQKGNSVWRNRIKRILREAVIKEKAILLDIADQKNSNLLIVFSPYSINQNNSKKIFLKEIKSAVLDILNKLKLTSAQ